jgi:hypothetical protein
MIYLGRREFYAEVRACAGRCALIVAEGHRQPGPRVSLPVLAYRVWLTVFDIDG